MTKLYKSILIPPAVLIVLIMRLLHPFITIRWGRINIARIGCITPADWYLSVHYGRMCKGKYFDIFGIIENYSANDAFIFVKSSRI